MFKIKNVKKVNMESTLKTKTNRIIKITETLKNIKRKEEKKYLTKNQYKLMIFGLEKLNYRIIKEISNFEKITKIPDFSNLSIKDKERKIPFLSFGEYQKEFFELFKNFDLNLISLKKTIKNQKTIKNSFLIRLNDLLKRNKDFSKTLKKFSKKNIDFDFDKNNSLLLIKKRSILKNYKEAGENQEEIKKIYKKKIKNNEMEIDFLNYTKNLYKDNEKIRYENIESNLDLKKNLNIKIIKIENLIKNLKLKKEKEISENLEIKIKNEDIILEIENEKEKIKNEKNDKIFFDEQKKFLDIVRPNERILLLKEEKEDLEINIKNKNFDKINLENDLDFRKKENKEIEIDFKNLEKEKKEKDLKILENKKNFENMKKEKKNNLNLLSKKKESVKFAENLFLSKKKEVIEFKMEIEDIKIKNSAVLKSLEFENKIDFLENKSLKKQSANLLYMKIQNLTNNIKKEKYYESDLKKKLKEKIFDPDFDFFDNQKLLKKKIDINDLKQKILILKYNDEKRISEMLKNENNLLLKKKEEKKKINLEDLNFLENKKKLDINFFEFKILNNKKKIENY